MHQLLSVVTDAVIAYLSAQRAAGAQALQVFDTWGGVLARRCTASSRCATSSASRSELNAATAWRAPR
jgi:uroporphyrinogen-III decarboxylase